MKIDLSTRKDYDIACAMRGPDSGNWVLKKVFTARLRHLAGIEEVVRSQLGRGWVPFGATTRLYHIGRGDARLIRDTHWVNEYHFLRHCGRAALALGNRGLEELAQALIHGKRLSLKRIIELAGGDEDRPRSSGWANPRQLPDHEGGR